MADQLSLLDEPAPVEPAPVADELTRLGAALPPRVCLGTSSWSFPGWAGRVYRGRYGRQRLARHGLGAYARHPLLRSVCVDRAYYRPLTVDAWRELAADVPADFRFMVKAPRDAIGRHVGDARDLDPRVARRAVEAMQQGLGDRLGPIVFQFTPGEPASADRFAAALARLLRALPAGPVYAIEPRTPRLLDAPYARMLADTGAVHCFTRHPAMPDIAWQRDRLPARPGLPFVARWNLGHGLGYEQARRRYWPFDRMVDPDPATREALARAGRQAAADDADAFIAVNNKAEGCAPASIVALARAIADRPDPLRDGGG